MSTTSGSEPKTIVSFKDQYDDRVFYRIKRDLNVKSLLKKYCEEKQVEYTTVDFLLNGNRLGRIGTFAQVGLKHGDEIDVMQHCGGGGPSK